jgi:hypothetical protein
MNAPPRLKQRATVGQVDTVPAAESHEEAGGDIQSPENLRRNAIVAALRIDISAMMQKAFGLDAFTIRRIALGYQSRAERVSVTL